MPVGQELVNANGGRPVARGDLAQLIRLNAESIAASFGVPVDLILNTKFSVKAQAEIALLNDTVRQLAKFTNQVLTDIYHRIYGDYDVEVELCVTPLAISDELLALHKSGLMPVKLGLERSLRMLGASKAKVDAAIKDALATTKRVEKRERSED